MPRTPSPRTTPPRRHLRLRNDSLVNSATAEIERVFGLPEGSVRLHLPRGRRAKATKTIRALRLDFKRHAWARGRPSSGSKKVEGKNPPAGIIARSRGTAPVDLRQLGKAPKGAEWVGSTEKDRGARQATKIIWRMLVAQRYTVEQIIATVLKHAGCCYTAEIAYDTILIVKEVMAERGVKGQTKNATLQLGRPF